MTIFEMQNEQQHILAKADRTDTANKYFPLWKTKNIQICYQGFAQWTGKENSGVQKETKTSCMLLEQQMWYFIYLFQNRRMLSEIFTSYMKIYGISFKFREPIRVSQHKEISFVSSWT